MSNSTPPTPEAPKPNATPWKVIVAVLVVLLLIVGLIASFFLIRRGQDEPPKKADPSVAPSNAPVPSGSEELKKYYEQKIKWDECGGMKCGTIEVPLDYAKPEGRAIKLAVLMNPARGKAIGNLVVNPGGPGGSGIEYAQTGAMQFGESLARSYNIVGFDPRGVGKSTPLKCLDTAGLDKVVAEDPDPDTPEEVKQYDETTKTFGDACVANGDGIAEHMSTVEAAKDIDILRAVLGDEKLNWFGASYGTFLGATYADLFPNHVGRMVLDGALDPSLSNEQLSLEQAQGFQTALDAYLHYCVNKGNCPLGKTFEETGPNLRKFLDSVDAKPLKTGTDRELTEGLATMGVWLPLYARSLWESLTPALRAAIDEGDGSQLLDLADYYSSRGPKAYKDNSMNALYAVNCLDHNDFIQSDEVAAKIPAFEAVSPVFGRTFAYSLSNCAQWPVKSGNVTKAIHAPGAPPIVVIGTTRDPATPYKWAESLAKQLESGVLIKRDGDGHTGFQAGNRCVDDAVNNYLVKGTVPKNGLSC